MNRPHIQIQDDYNWWGQLPGETYRYIEANAEHSQATTVLRLITSVESFWLSWWVAVHWHKWR